MISRLLCPFLISLIGLCTLSAATSTDGQSVTRAPQFSISDETLQLALKENAPTWDYVFKKRGHPFDESFGFYTLALTAYGGTETQKEIVGSAVAQKLRETLAGGKEPEAVGGLGGWTHGSFAWALAFIRHTPAVWNQLTNEDKKRADLIMQAMAVASNFCLDDDNDYRTMLDGDKNFAKTFNPNHVEGYIAVAMAAGWYFGQDELNAFFKSFDFDAFVLRLKETGFTNVVNAWTRTPETRQALTGGGPFSATDKTFGTGKGVRGNDLTVRGLPVGDSWEIYATLGNKMFYHSVQTEIPITGRDESTHIVAKGACGAFLISPYEKQLGMCYEFHTTNAPKRGSNFRSSLPYVYEGWSQDMGSLIAQLVRGVIPQNEKVLELGSKISVGTRDFLFKAENGYAGFANGGPVVADKSTLQKTGGWPFAMVWWENIKNSPQLMKP